MGGNSSSAAWALADDVLSRDVLLRIVLWILLSLDTCDVGTESVHLLAKYFSATALQQVIKQNLEEGESDADAVLVWLRIASVISNLLSTVIDMNPRASLFDGTAILSRLAAILSGDKNIFAANRRRAIADSLVLSMCALNQEVFFRFLFFLLLLLISGFL